MKIDIAIQNAIIISCENDYVPYVGDVGIVNDTISFIGNPYETNLMDVDITFDASSKVLMPGLFNCHCHGDMTIARGFGDDLTLLEQNEEFKSHNWFKEFVDDDDRFASRQLTYCEALLTGTTFITENMYWSLGLDSIIAMSQVGIKGALVEDIRKDFNKPNEFISELFLKEFIKACDNSGLIAVIGSVSEEDFTSGLISKIRKKAFGLNAFVTLHLAENEWRYKIIKDNYGVSPVKFLDQCSFLNGLVIGSHVVNVNKEDLQILYDSQTKVVSTPICEMKIEDGVAPISDMLSKGINVSLGTDGALWNNSNDIFQEMKATALIQTMKNGIRSIRKKDILNMATINGAKTFGIQDQYGSIKVGKKASIILIEATGASWQPVRTGEFENITSNLVFNTTGSHVTDVFVDGTWVVKNKKIRTINIDALIKKVQIASNKVVSGLK